MTVLVRVDASRERGLGHLARCLALADALRARGASTVFASLDLPSAAKALIAAQGHAALDLPPLAGGVAASVAALGPEREWPADAQDADAAATRAAARAAGYDPARIVVDHYGLGRAWEARVAEDGALVAAIDDLGRAHACALVVDQNAGRDRHDPYVDRVPASCRRLLGPRYAMLRGEFAELHRVARARSGPVARILVSVGGADSGDATGAVLAAITRAGLADRVLDVVVGALYPHLERLRSACAPLQQVTLHVQTDRLAELMTLADLAVGAGGGTTWERCALGVPSLVLTLAENQRAPVRAAAAEGLVYAPDVAPGDIEGLAIHLAALDANASLRGFLSARGLARVDGGGAARVAAAILPAPIALRPATLADAEALHAWRNDPEVRAVSRESDPIHFDGHLSWLGRVLADPDRDLLIGEAEGGPVGVLRFDRSGEEAEVSIYLVPGASGRGAGTDLLLAGCDWLRQNRPGMRVVVAEVLGGNARSAALFERCGFTERSRRYTRGLDT
ncbi:UDP-2,4-diacetamido-2,4,6-trideoxy-beta-L-altropyranose hydrolase [Salinarimonas rosea]|uniref:UDP-2,4-diacetamido-2,4, 6-trideoxy-beta-L-altropyranose hydrolase n=1 Tax=Salinarimonas rosea TaxID=552063 RepID=UPI00040C39CF|nr:UDP-2,4-diacetamido-2,4,6-trideoxy-beta-L-altropyranose hydrolase [Salinarimonas rosea]